MTGKGAGMSTDKFFRGPRVTMTTSEGRVELPIEYRDATATTAVFAVQPERARPLLHDSGLVPLLFRGRTAAVAISWFDYRDTSIGPYHELSIAVLAHHPLDAPRSALLGLLRGGGAVGGHILHLPVTTEIACAGGRELWGYPKFVAEMPIGVSGGRMEGALVHDGQRVLSMQIPVPGGPGLPMPDLNTLSVLDDRLIRTRIATHCRTRLARGNGVELVLEQPGHPVCRTLASLGLPSRATLVLHSDPFLSLLPLGLAVADAARGSRLGERASAGTAEAATHRTA